MQGRGEAQVGLVADEAASDWMEMLREKLVRIVPVLMAARMAGFAYCIHSMVNLCGLE